MIVPNSANLRKPKQTLFEQARSLLGIILLAFIIRTFVYGLYQVPTPSMETTMLVGERFLADKFTVCFKSPKAGEIVTLNEPIYKYSSNFIKNVWQRYVWGPSNWTKRVIGVPGDELKGVLEDGRPVVYIKHSGDADFAKLDEPYLNKYPIVATQVPGRSAGEFTYRSWDQSQPLNQQPFYQFTDSEIRLGRQKAKLYGDRSVKYPGTTYIHNVDPAKQTWLTGETHYGQAVLDEFHVKLGADEFWLMGDNRLGSYDSRASVLIIEVF